MQAVLTSLTTDNKGRAVAMVVINGTADQVSQQIAGGPVQLDVQTIAQAKAAALPQKQKGGPLTKWLAAREGEAKFQQFLKKVYGRNVTNQVTAEAAVKDLMQIASRTELDHNPDKGMKFRRDIMLKFGEFR